VALRRDLAPADRLEIIELTARYAFYVDTFQLEPLMQLWVDDEPTFDESRVDLGNNTGLDNIRRYFEDFVFGHMAKLAHITTNNIVESVTDTTAQGLCSVLVEGEMKTGERMHAAAYYDDVYHRVDGAWKFKSRVVHPLTTPNLGSLVS
jgi:hypothetical protein